MLGQEAEHAALRQQMPRQRLHIQHVPLRTRLTLHNPTIPAHGQSDRRARGRIVQQSPSAMRAVTGASLVSLTVGLGVADGGGDNEERVGWEAGADWVGFGELTPPPVQPARQPAITVALVIQPVILVPRILPPSRLRPAPIESRTPKLLLPSQPYRDLHPH